METHLPVRVGIGPSVCGRPKRENINAPLTGNISGIECVAFSPDGTTLAGGTWREIRLWDADTGEPKQTFAGNTREVESVAFSPDGNTLVSATLEGTLLLWEVIPTAKLSLFSPNLLTQYHTQWGLPEGVKARLGKGRIAEIQYFPDGTRLVVASAIGIWFYDTATHKEVALFTGAYGYNQEHSIQSGWKHYWQRERNHGATVGYQNRRTQRMARWTYE